MIPQAANCSGSNNNPGQTTNLEIIAEGVETEEQRQLLMHIGCSNFQGCLFGKAESVDQFEVLLKKIAVPGHGI